jgi:effector-binding domain-containing protein
MRKTVLVLTLIAACGAWVFGQEVKIQENTPFTYAYLEGNGPYQGVGAKIGELMEEAGQQGLQFQGTPFGLYLNSPQEVKSPDEYKWLVGVPVAAEAKIAAPLLRGEYKHTLVARCMFKGPYEAVSSTYGAIFAFIAQNGYRPAGPIMEMYWNDPMTVPAAELLTEIIIPVAKK